MYSPPPAALCLTKRPADAHVAKEKATDYAAAAFPNQEGEKSGNYTTLSREASYHLLDINAIEMSYRTNEQASRLYQIGRPCAPFIFLALTTIIVALL